MLELVSAYVTAVALCPKAWLGVMAMPRTPIQRSAEDDAAALDEGGAIDASLLPPG